MSEPWMGIACHALEVQAGRRQLIRGLSWSHRPPGVVWVTGSNGAGKSSLLEVLAGFRKPAAGCVQWFGSAGAPRYYAPNMQAVPNLRVADFVEFVGRAAAAISPIHALYPASVLEQASFGRLSTGEAKRLLLWGLLSSGDAALVLDEPYEHLAVAAKIQLTRILRQRAQEGIVVVATNQEVGTAAGDCVLDINDTAVTVLHAR